MAKKRRWSRYVPPHEQLDEEGRPERLRPVETVEPIPYGCGAGVVVIIIAAVVGLVVAFVVGSPGRDDDSADSSDVEIPELRTDSLEGDFLERALDNAAQYLPGRDPYAIFLDGAGVSVEFYVPEQDAVHRLRTSTYDGGADYRVSVQDDHEGFPPTPFDLDLVRPEVLVETTETALGDVESPIDWYTYVDVDREATDATITTRVSSADGTEQGVRRDTDLDGTEISSTP